MPDPLDFNWDQKTLSKEACDYIAAVFEEVFGSLPKAKQRNLIGSANDIYLFFSAVKKTFGP